MTLDVYERERRDLFPFTAISAELFSWRPLHCALPSSKAARKESKDQAELDMADMEDVEEVEDEEGGEDVNSKARQLTAQMMQNPQILAALQERLDGLVGSPSGYMERPDGISPPHPHPSAPTPLITP
ncbi:hypothetical protein JZ751_022109 [Albula glossodonta]|uniref:Uncharacterized protein n=1 Tax=Albula glossodonta TaxID=121402 RepID=A0A8T2NIA8_9TELE|nr:hypothetical protein JZ751_022109 [Albula glossodonta]